MIFSVKNLSFSYENTPVLQNINFQMTAGEVVVLLGPNGAGKTTILKCMDRLLPYNQGEITIDGNNIAAMKPTELATAMAYVSQKFSFGDSTVFDTVLMGRKPYIRWEASQKDLKIVSDLLEQFSLSHVALRNVCELSGGEQQKVAIARALAQEPQILLFDEPTSNLDLKNQMETVELIERIAKDREVAIFITMHDLNLALRLGHRFLFMKEGSIVANGGREMITAQTIKNVYDREVVVTQIEGCTVVVPL